MTDRTTTRRGLIVAAGAGVGGLAGCLTSDDSSDDPDDSNGDSNEPDDSSETLDGVHRTDIEARRERMPDPGVDLEWASAREFRSWLFDDGNETTGRFDYTEDLPPTDEVDSPVLEVFDVYPDRVDALLSQGASQVVLGAFDADALEDRLADADGYAVGDEHRGFAVADRLDGSDETPAGPIAVGDDALVLGPGYERPIDVRHGDRDPLEAVDPWLTHLFETLPDGALVSGAYLTPREVGIDVAEIYCWGISMAERDPETATAAFVFDNPADITDDVRAEVETLFESISDRETDGRTLTIAGTVPELLDRSQ